MAMTLPRLIPTVRRIERVIGGPLESAIGRGQGVGPMLRVARLSRGLAGSRKAVNVTFPGLVDWLRRHSDPKEG